jgi:hypothetical protein
MGGSKMVRVLTILTAVTLVLLIPAANGQGTGQEKAQAAGSANVQANQSSGQASAGSTASKQGEQEGSLGAGTALNTQLSQTVDSKKAKAGDTVTAQTTDAVKAEGKTVLPRGTKVVGHVTRASARAKGDAESALAVQFDRAILKDGHEIPLQASIQALAPPQSVTPVGGDDLQPAPGMGTGAAGAGSASGRGMPAGVGATVGGAASGAASTVPRTTEATGGVSSAAGGAVNSAGHAAGTGLNAAGELTSTSRGVFGLNGLSLNSGATNSSEGSVITSAGKNVHLDSGTQMLVVVQATTSTSAQR